MRWRSTSIAAASGTRRLSRTSARTPPRASSDASNAIRRRRSDAASRPDGVTRVGVDEADRAALVRRRALERRRRLREQSAGPAAARLAARGRPRRRPDLRSVSEERPRPIAGSGLATRSWSSPSRTGRRRFARSGPIASSIPIRKYAPSAGSARSRRRSCSSTSTSRSIRARSILVPGATPIRRPISSSTRDGRSSRGRT